MTDNFCVIPWLSFTLDNVGEVRPCCKYAQNFEQDEYKTLSIKNHTIEEIWNSDNFQKIRQAFLDNKRIPECSSCWKEEEAGLSSYRQLYNSRYLGNGKSYDTTIALPAKLIDLKLSNVCNFKCRMCDATTSNLILKEDKKFKNKNFPDEEFYLKDKILNTENENYFIENILPNLLRIDFTGGEPFFNPEAKKIIEIISKTEYAKNISVIITTNGSIINEVILENLRHFKRVDITLSVDDIGSRLEYQRNGANWDIIKSNIEYLKSKEWIIISLHPTVNNYSIWHFDELLNWAESIDIPIIINILHGPENLCIRHLPKQVKEKITLKFKNDNRLSEVLSYMNNSDDKNYIIDFLKHTNYLDLIREEFFDDVYSEWSELIYDNM